MHTMKDSNKDMKNIKIIKTIKIELSKEEYDQVSEQAERMKLSLRKYAKMRVLDQEPGPDMRCRQIMQLMPYFYHAADSVADSNVQQELWKIGGQICRCLR